MLSIPSDLDEVLDNAWGVAQHIPGYLVEAEARFLGTIVACAPPSNGAIVEIGSYKGKSTVMLAKVAAHYGLGPIVAIDPHNFSNPELLDQRTRPDTSSYDEFMRNIRNAGVANQVEPHRAYSADVARTWSSSIRFLWIDGDHTYTGAKSDFDGFSRHLLPLSIVALHDALHPFSGPIRVFVEEVLRSDNFGAAGVVHSIAWAQFRPEDGRRFQSRRAKLELAVSRLIPFVRDDGNLHGLTKIRYKLNRSRVSRSAVQPREWASQLDITA